MPWGQSQTETQLVSFPVGDSVSHQEVSEAFCALHPFLVAFHMTELYCHRLGVSHIDLTLVANTVTYH